MKYLILFVVVFALLVNSCSSSKKTAISEQSNENDAVELLSLMGSADSLQQDAFELDSLKIVGDELEVYVNYSGGCGEANFQLYYTQLMLNSYPPQTSLHLAFTDEDPCRAIEFKKLTFGLKPFREFAENGGIWLRIAGFDQQVLYVHDK